MNLECSRYGDQRFSDLHAKVLFGTVDTIMNHYKNHTVGNDLHLNGKVYHNKSAYFYTYLWWLYLESNPDLVSYAKRFDSFSDSSKGKYCQSDFVDFFISSPDSYRDKIRFIKRELDL